LLAMLFLSLWSIGLTLSFYYVSELIFRVNNLNFAFGILFFVMFIDLVRNDTLSIIKTSITSGTLIAIFILIWFPDSVVLMNMGDYSVPYWNSLNLVVSYFMLYVALISILNYCAIVLKNAPKRFKSDSKRIILGVCIFAFGTFTASLFMSFIGMEIASGVGFLISGYYVIKYSELLYVLPFTVHRLTVIDRSSGIMLYDYAWTDNPINSTLIGGLLQGLQNISTEVLKRGEIEEIKLKSGILLFRSTPNILVGLLTSKTSAHLRDGFGKFVSEFENCFQQNLENNNVSNCNYEEADNLIKSIFANIPDLKETKEKES
jgi:hypothetical protein